MLLPADPTAGTPEINPALPPDVVSVRPWGKLPLMMLHVIGGTPPELVKVVEYATPTIPEGSGLVVVIVNGSLTRIVSGAIAVCGGLPVSVTRNVELNNPVVVAVPLMVAPLTVKPAGSVPESIVHVYVPDPPVAVSARA